jgi:hypothetical protein
MPPGVPTEPPAGEGAGELLQALQSLSEGLINPCVRTCSCLKLPQVLEKCAGHVTDPVADASRDDSQLQELMHLLPKLAAALGGHDYKTRDNNVQLFNM